jgi:hypothetical protein
VITSQDRRLTGLAAEGRWADLLDAHRRARAAHAPGAAAIGHLIAYGAPPETSARLFDTDGAPGSAARSADHDAGPLWEVLATRHSWRRLAPLLDPPPVRRLVAHTRALLGEDLIHGVEPDPEGVPLVLQPWEVPGWEPACRVREYLPYGGARRALMAFPTTREGLGPVDLPLPAGRTPGLAATRLLDGLAPWLTAVCVRGAALDAAAQLAPDRRPTGGYVPFAAAYPALVQAASCLPCHGTADGRLAVWRVLAAITGEPRVDVPQVNALVARLRCFTWCDLDDELRYLHLAVEDPATGLSWALTGTDPA